MIPMEHNELIEKAGVIRLLLENEGRVMLCMDATHDGVDVPRRFSGDTGLMLVLNNTMPQPIHILADSVASELRFGGIPHYCIIPYTALWSVFNPDTNHGKTWINSIPEGIRQVHTALHVPLKELPWDQATIRAAAQTESEETTTKNAEPNLTPVPARTSAPFLRVIEGGDKTQPTQKTEPTKRKPSLRLVD